MVPVFFQMKLIASNPTSKAFGTELEVEIGYDPDNVAPYTIPVSAPYYLRLVSRFLNEELYAYHDTQECFLAEMHKHFTSDVVTHVVPAQWLK